MSTPIAPSPSATYTVAYCIIQAQMQMVEALSSLNMEPSPMENPEGFYLSETDKWAAHSREHLHAALDWTEAAAAAEARIRAAAFEAEARIRAAAKDVVRQFGFTE